MIKPEEAQAITDDDTNAIAELERIFDARIRASCFFGIDVLHGEEVDGAPAPPARIILAVLNKYAEAGWLVASTHSEVLHASPSEKMGNKSLAFHIRIKKEERRQIKT